MFAFNRVILTGRVATSPRCSYRPDGSPVIQFPLALDETEDRKRRVVPARHRQPTVDGVMMSVTRRSSGAEDLIHIVAIGKLAEVKMDLQSGQHLLVIGRLHQRSWKTPEGTNRTRTEVIATDLRPLGEIRSDPRQLPGKLDP
ncbi:MAG: single-stranded DNA-binding protein [Thermodesulfobacteriota bacterium]